VPESACGKLRITAEKSNCAGLWWWADRLLHQDQEETSTRRRRRRRLPVSLFVYLSIYLSVCLRSVFVRKLNHACICVSVRVAVCITVRISLCILCFLIECDLVLSSMFINCNGGKFVRCILICPWLCVLILIADDATYGGKKNIEISNFIYVKQQLIVHHYLVPLFRALCHLCKRCALCWGVGMSFKF
jgi:hypothetical protein